jgi:hypothetical protein
MTLKNTSTQMEVIQCMRVFAPSGISFTNATGPPGTHLENAGTAFSNLILSMAPNGSVDFQFQTTGPLDPSKPPRVNVSASCKGDFPAQVTVTVCDITFGLLSDGTQSLNYESSVDPKGGAAPYAYDAVTNLPPGLTFTNGVLSGVPTKPGSYTFTVSVTDSKGCRKSAEFTVKILTRLEKIGVDIAQEIGRIEGEGVPVEELRLYAQQVHRLKVGVMDNELPNVCGEDMQFWYLPLESLDEKLRAVPKEGRAAANQAKALLKKITSALDDHEKCVRHRKAETNAAKRLKHTIGKLAKKRTESLVTKAHAQKVSLMDELPKVKGHLFGYWYGLFETVDVEMDDAVAALRNGSKPKTLEALRKAAAAVNKLKQNL